MTVSSVNKALAALATAVLSIVAAWFGLDLTNAEAFVMSAIPLLGTLIVWWVPNVGDHYGRLKEIVDVSTAKLETAARELSAARDRLKAAGDA